MRGKWLLVVRRLHLYLSVFFAPLLLLFVITGWAQTADFDHSSALMGRLSQVHKNQFFPAAQTTKSAGNGFAGKTGRSQRREAALPMRWLVVAMCIALLTSISLGLILAFTMVRNRVPVWIALILGVATPVLLLALAHAK